MTDDTEKLTPEQIEAALARLEQEKQRRATDNPPAPELINTVERVVVSPTDNNIITAADGRRAGQAALKSQEKPKRRRKRQEEPPPAAPQYVTVQLGKPGASDPAGVIAEAWYITRGNRVFLCDADGHVTSDGHPIIAGNVLHTAKQALRNRVSAKRLGEPNHQPIRYAATGWR